MWKWILLILQSVQPNAPWSATYEETARAIDDVAHESPIYDSNDGVERTIAEIVAVARFESTFDPHAIGDHGQSLGFGQIGVSNVRRLGIDRDDLLDVRENVRAMVRLLKESHRVCRANAPEDQLAAYATGNARCRVAEGLAASRHRMAYARWILRTYRPFWVEPVAKSATQP